MPGKLLPNLKARFFDANGDPLAGGKLYSYDAGTTTPRATFSNSEVSVPNANPVVLDANGEATVWVDGSYYKFILTDANDVVQFTMDDVTAFEDVVAEAVTARNAAQAAQAAAETAETNAETAETNAEAAQAAAATSASNAATSETNAANSASAASTSASNASTSATNASNSASAASTSASNAATSETNAAASAVAAAASAATLILPAGMIVPYAGTSAPTNWLLCYGQAISRTTYSALFTAISTTYGAGDGSTTFNLPDLRGRVLAGKDDMGGSAASRLTSGGSGINGATLGAVGGAETHTLTSAQMPSHTHTQDAHNHGPTGNTDFFGSNAGGGGTYGGTQPNPFGAAATTANTTATNQNSGSGGAHNNTQPTIVLNYIIKI